MVMGLRKLRDKAWEMANKLMQSEREIDYKLGLEFTIIAQTLDYILDGEESPAIKILKKM